MCSFLEHIYLLIVVSSLAFQNAFYTLYAWFYLPLVSMVFWGNFRYFRRFQGILRCVRDLDTLIEDYSRAPKLSKAFQVFLKVPARCGRHLRLQRFDWAKENKDSTESKYHSVKLINASGEPYINSSEWLQNSKETSSKCLESPNVPSFGRMRYHSGEAWSHSAEWKPQTAWFLFFINRTPRAFRAFYPFCSLAYKYPSFL